MIKLLLKELTVEESKIFGAENSFWNIKCNMKKVNINYYEMHSSNFKQLSL